jgi:hypothetical protein
VGKRQENRKKAGATNETGRTSASTTSKEAGASNAAGRAPASTTAKETNASNAEGRASASKTAEEASARIAETSKQDYHSRWKETPHDVFQVWSLLPSILSHHALPASDVLCLQGY